MKDKSLKYLIAADGHITVIVEGSPLLIAKEHSAYNTVKALLRSGSEDEILQAFIGKKVNFLLKKRKLCRASIQKGESLPCSICKSETFCYDLSKYFLHSERKIPK